MAGVFVYSPDQIRSRYQEEIDKFNIDLKTGIYNNDLVALTFQQAFLGVFGSIAVVYSKELNQIIVTHNGKQIRGPEAINLLNNIVRSSKSPKESAMKSQVDSSTPAESELKLESKSKSESHAGVNFGGSAKGAAANASSAFKTKDSEDQIRAASTSVQSKQVASKGQTIEVINSSNSPATFKSSEQSAESLAQSDHFVDSIRLLCEQFASEPVSEIEYIESLAPEAPPEDQSSAVVQEINKSTKSTENTSGVDISTSKVTEEVQKRSQTATSREPDSSELERPIPAQIRKISLGQPGFGVAGEDISIAIFGTMHVVKRLSGYKADSRGVIKLDSPVFEEITVKEIMVGLEEGVYVAEHYEDSNLGISPGVKGQPTEPIFFRIQKPRAAVSQDKQQVKVGSRKSDIDEMEKKAEQEAAKAAQKAEESAKAASSRRKENDEARRARVAEQRKKEKDGKTKIPENIKKYLNRKIESGLPPEEQAQVVKQVERMRSVGVSVERIVRFVEDHIKGRDARNKREAEKERSKSKQKSKGKDNKKGQSAKGKKSSSGASGGKGGGGKGGGGY